MGGGGIRSIDDGVVSTLVFIFVAIAPVLS